MIIIYLRAIETPGGGAYPDFLKCNKDAKTKIIFVCVVSILTTACVLDLPEYIPLKAYLTQSQELGDIGECPNGGVELRQGVDANANGQLDEATYEALGLLPDRGRGRGVVTTSPTKTPEPIDPSTLKRPLPSTRKPGSRSRPTIRVPSRRRGQITPLQPGYLIREIPTFDKEAQIRLIVASQISTQREFPRGVYASSPPVDSTIIRR